MGAIVFFVVFQWVYYTVIAALFAFGRVMKKFWVGIIMVLSGIAMCYFSGRWIDKLFDFCSIEEIPDAVAVTSSLVMLFAAYLGFSALIKKKKRKAIVFLTLNVLAAVALGVAFGCMGIEPKFLCESL